MSKRILGFILATLCLGFVPAGHAQSARKLDWGPAPPFLPAGAQFALVSGDPGKPGPFEVRLALPNGYVVPPHWHPTDEHVTVKTGHFRYGMGEKIDAKSEKSLRPGQSVNLQANMRHWARSQGRTVIAITGNGPFTITYVNTADDPRNAKPKAR